jgi:hypothetical protein
MDFYQIYSLYLTGPPLTEFPVCSKRDLTKSKHFQFDSFQQPSKYMSGKFEHFHTLIYILKLDLDFQNSLMKIDLTRLLSMRFICCLSWLIEYKACLNSLPLKKGLKTYLSYARKTPPPPLGFVEKLLDANLN